MNALALLMAVAATASPPREEAPRGGENLLVGPARCVLRYLEAVRLAGPRAPETSPGRPPVAHESDYARARQLTAPRALAEVERLAARGEDHPLAPWREAARGRVLESFQLVSVRRAPRGTAVVAVLERYWNVSSRAPIERSASEYLVARVGGDWRIVDRRPGGAFEDDAIATGYAGCFDEPTASR